MKTTISDYYYAAKLNTWLEISLSDHGLRRLDFCMTHESRKTNLNNDLIQNIFIQLDKYFTGGRTKFDIPIHFQDATEFQREVWEYLLKIPFGVTKSYQQVAMEIGNPKAFRAVGNANSRNPVPIIVPCHRVIKTDGSLGGYSSGLDMKRLLLEHEGANYKH